MTSVAIDLTPRSDSSSGRRETATTSCSSGSSDRSARPTTPLAPRTAILTADFPGRAELRSAGRSSCVDGLAPGSRRARAKLGLLGRPTSRGENPRIAIRSRHPRASWWSNTSSPPAPRASSPPRIRYVHETPVGPTSTCTTPNRSSTGVRPRNRSSRLSAIRRVSHCSAGPALTLLPVGGAEPDRALLDSGYDWTRQGERLFGVDTHERGVSNGREADRRAHAQAGPPPTALRRCDPRVAAPAAADGALLDDLVTAARPTSPYTIRLAAFVSPNSRRKIAATRSETTARATETPVQATDDDEHGREDIELLHRTTSLCREFVVVFVLYRPVLCQVYV